MARYGIKDLFILFPGNLLIPLYGIDRMLHETLCIIAKFLIPAEDAQIMAKTGSHHYPQGIIIRQASSEAYPHSLDCDSECMVAYCRAEMMLLQKSFRKLFGAQYITAVFYDNIYDFLFHPFSFPPVSCNLSLMSS
jgi:hypothetical protein